MCEHSGRLSPDLTSFDGYVLIIVNDTPYNEGVEFWFNNDLEDLIGNAQSEWDSICGRCDISIYRFKYSRPYEVIEDIIPEEDEEEWCDIGKEKWGVVDKEKYPTIETEDDYINLYVCDSCHVFGKEQGKCNFCGHQTRWTESELYPRD